MNHIGWSRPPRWDPVLKQGPIAAALTSLYDSMVISILFDSIVIITILSEGSPGSHPRTPLWTNRLGLVWACPSCPRLTPGIRPYARCHYQVYRAVGPRRLGVPGSTIQWIPALGVYWPTLLVYPGASCNPVYDHARCQDNAALGRCDAPCATVGVVRLAV